MFVAALDDGIDHADRHEIGHAVECRVVGAEVSTSVEVGYVAVQVVVHVVVGWAMLPAFADEVDEYATAEWWNGADRNSARVSAAEDGSHWVGMVAQVCCEPDRARAFAARCGLAMKLADVDDWVAAAVECCVSVVLIAAPVRDDCRLDRNVTHVVTVIRLTVSGHLETESPRM